MSDPLPDATALYRRIYADLVDLGIPEKRAGELAYEQVQGALVDEGAAQEEAKEPAP